ncbi:MAG TPA: hypothetical protein VFN71_09950 [Methylomirabilota bacterium]|nr:hypothetical protein [Methylomirabilota bacterium]
MSGSVVYLHVHVMLRRKGNGLRGFFWPRGRYRDAAEMAAMREWLGSALAEIAGSR